MSNKLFNYFKNIELLKDVYIRFLQVLFKIFAKFPVKQNRIVFESFLGKQYSDNPRAIFEYITDKNLNFDCYWSFDREHVDKFRKKNLKVVKRLTIKWVYYMATSKYWITNSRLPYWIPKFNRTIYIQTWHGTPLKKLGVDIENVQMPGVDTESYKQQFVHEAQKWDYLISPNAYSTNIFRRAFAFKKNLIESGYPRNDYLIKNNQAETILKLKEIIGLPKEKKVILYAPTWRDNQYYQVGRYKFDIQLNLNKLRKELGDDYIILLRLHYLVSENLDLSGFEDFVFDFSNYEDIRELYLISDLLITDYSSVFFDYANLKRPIIFFVYDIEDYRDVIRGFYFNLEELAPGPLVKTNDELITSIKTIDKIKFVYQDKFDNFYKTFCYLEDGNASERVVKEILLK